MAGLTCTVQNRKRNVAPVDINLTTRKPRLSRFMISFLSFAQRYGRADGSPAAGEPYAPPAGSMLFFIVLCIPKTTMLHRVVGCLHGPVSASGRT